MNNQILTLIVWGDQVTTALWSVVLFVGQLSDGPVIVWPWLDIGWLHHVPVCVLVCFNNTGLIACDLTMPASGVLSWAQWMSLLNPVTCWHNINGSLFYRWMALWNYILWANRRTFVIPQHSMSHYCSHVCMCSCVQRMSPFKISYLHIAETFKVCHDLELVV